jgi:hypothetical protein
MQIDVYKSIILDIRTHKELRRLSPQANYIDQATAAFVHIILKSLRLHRNYSGPVSHVLKSVVLVWKMTCLNFDKRMQLVSTLCGQNRVPDATCASSNHSVLKGSVVH